VNIENSSNVLAADSMAYSERIAFNLNSLIIYPLIESDLGSYECIINSKENIIKKFELKIINTTNNAFNVEVFGDTVEISSNYLSKHFNSQNGLIFWRKLNHSFSDTFDLDHFHKKVI
jgi:hypothetical protein